MRLTALAPALILVALAQPSLAADRFVPQTAKGALESHRGKPWTEPLFTCAGFHTYNMRRLKGAGETSDAWDALGRVADFKDAGAAQWAKDKGVNAAAAAAQATKASDNYSIAIEMEDLDDAGVREWTAACDEIWAGYRKAGA